MTIAAYTSREFQTKSGARRNGLAAKETKGFARVRFFETANGWVYKLYA